jgi:hypothetical protein
VVSGETNRELSYEKVTAELKQRNQQMLDEMRGRNSGDHAILLR